MLRRGLLAVATTAALASAATACTVTGPPVVDPVARFTPPYDLDDPDLQEALGVAPVDGEQWRRLLDEVTVIGFGPTPEPRELDLIEGAIAEVPRPLDRTVRPRAVIRTPDATTDDPAHADAVSFTQGPDVFFFDRSFTATEGDTTRFDLARAYLHELAHVAQYRSLSDDYVTAALDGRLDRLDVTAGSTLVVEFAAATGWMPVGDDPLRPVWELPEGLAASTPYGLEEGPAEDMAEAVSLVALGRAEWLPADRVAWVEQWIGTDAASLADGKPWAPAGSSEVLSLQPLFTEEELAPFQAGYRYAEPLYFALPAEVAAHEQLADQVQRHLTDRRLVGTLIRTDDPRLPRYTGWFTRRDGLGYWVELWDFREATGFRSAPENPILTYVALW